MKQTLLFSFCFFFCSIVLQAQDHPLHFENKSSTPIDLTRKLEDRNGRLITDPKEKEAYLRAQQDQQQKESKAHLQKATSQPAVHLCGNSGFEEFETVSGVNVLKHYQYTEVNPSNPTQCITPDTNTNLYIPQYDPSNTYLMANTVPSNFFDEYIGDIHAFDQYTLKINHKNSSPTSGVVQTKRFKTNNETEIKFNYKAVLQSISESGHLGEQPFFKARIINKNGVVVSEFCTVGDPTNCIFTQHPTLAGGYIVLYTKNWQSGILDISSIPNNEEFTVEFTAARCGLNGHFGYAYVDDICMLHSDENLQGSIQLDPLYKVCPTLPLSVCGTFTLPNSGGISASVTSLTMNVYNAANTVVYTSSTPLSLSIPNKTFCFELKAVNLPNIVNANYNIGVVIQYGVLQSSCTGTSFPSAMDNDANPGSDISFLNCTPTCNFTLQTGTLVSCDTNKDGKEFFNLTNVNTQLTGVQTGLTYAYFKTLQDATNNTNPILTFANYESYTATIFVRIQKDPSCFKIIAFEVIVKNPSASISGILNICSGNTTLTASPGIGYLWSNGATTQSTVISSTGNFSVKVTDINGCEAIASVTILPNSVAVLPTIQVTQPNCFSNTGTITVVSPASEYSYDGGMTWSTNAQMDNVPIGTYLVKIKTAMGCISYDNTVEIISYLSSFPHFSSVNPTYCDDVGSITITTIASEYSFDDGVTWTTSNVADNLPLGTYLIRTKDAFGCISNYNSVYLQGQFLPIPQYTTESPYCADNGKIIITSPGFEFSYDGGNSWQTSNIFDNLAAGSYVIKVRTAQGCTSPNVYVYLINFENTSPEYLIDDAGCDKYATITITTPGDFYSFDGGTTWTTNNSLGNLNGGVGFALQVRKGANCYSYISSAYISSYFRALPVVTNYSTLICDELNNEKENVDLTLYQSLLVNNSANHSFKYYNTLAAAEQQINLELITSPNYYNFNVTQKIFYVRVTDIYGCSSIATIELTLIPTPIITLEDKYYLCENSTVTISESTVFDSYLWSTGSTDPTIVVSQPGDYSLTVTQNHGLVICSTVKTFPVILSNPAIITHFDLQDWTIYNNVITVNVTGLGNYEYSLDGIKYQDSNIFEHLEPGENKIYVRDKNGCGITVSDEVYLLIYPKFFTPNGDGFNDFWKITFSQKEPNLTVKIFDRHGKFMKLLDATAGWDGTYLGAPAPASDYWFTVTRQNGKVYTEHFTLKR